MYLQFRRLLTVFRRAIQQDIECSLTGVPQYNRFFVACHVFPPCLPFNLIKSHGFHFGDDLNQETEFREPYKDFEQQPPVHIDKTALRVQNLLKELSGSSNEECVRALDDCELSLSEDLVLDVLRRFCSDWSLAYLFFNWVSNDRSGFLLGFKACNEMLGILGRAKRFKELEQLFDEMAKKGTMNERSYGIVVHRYAAAHKTDDAIQFYYKRKQYGLPIDLVAFQTLLMALCRYKHVEEAEYLLLLKKGEFQYDIKTWNIILNGWCVLGNLHETKRFWNEVIRSKCEPDKITYGIFINALCKSGKISTAVKVFHSMWEKGCIPDVVICNSVIDGLCFKKRIPEALRIMREMNEKDCEPDVVTYNCLIKHLCKIQRIKEAFEILDEMEIRGGKASPNSRTYSHLLTSSKSLEEVQRLIKRMKSNGCEMTGDLYNMLLKLYMKWDCEEQVQLTWAEMSRDGMGPDQRSYTVMIHGRHDQGRIEDALSYFKEMVSKGMMPEPRTNLLVDAMEIKMKEKHVDKTSNTNLSKHAHRS